MAFLTICLTEKQDLHLVPGDFYKNRIASKNCVKGYLKRFPIHQEKNHLCFFKVFSHSGLRILNSAISLELTSQRGWLFTSQDRLLKDKRWFENV